DSSPASARSSHEWWCCANRTHENIARCHRNTESIINDMAGCIYRPGWTVSDLATRPVHVPAISGEWHAEWHGGQHHHRVWRLRPKQQQRYWCCEYDGRDRGRLE